ncbi:MAG: M3 family oligoendopeptidase [Candidatus Bathyarchaeota archaeon]|nr:M3 family oligoendopeptidase [Candidatus Bathyarchaeota archaeon]
MVQVDVGWDLSELFPSIDDISVGKAVFELSELSEGFKQKYKGKIYAFTPQNLLCCLEELEAFKAKLQTLSLYASLSFSADMTSFKTQELYDKVKKFEAHLGKQLAFFQLELADLIKKHPQFIVDPLLVNYRHWLERVHRRAAYLLSEVEEQLVIEKDQFGVNAWEDLQRKWLNTRIFEVNVLGEKKLLSYGEANGLLSHPDRATRESANRVIYGVLGRDGEIFAAALRNICNDWMCISERRGYASPMEASLLSNDVTQSIVDNLLHTVEENVQLYRRYLKIKAELMGLPILGNHDIIAPLPNTSIFRFTFEDAQRLVMRAYSKFDDEYSAAVKQVFTKRHIDVFPRFGKRNGAFCASWYSGKSSFILSNFTGSLNDVFTLAHELGHAVHNYYAQRSQTILNLSMPSVVAETASIFGELLLADLLLAESNSDEERKALLCLVLDEAGMVIFQVTARVWFEQALYSSIHKGEYLDYQVICSHWVSARTRIYGDVVEWFPEMEAEWTIKPHYYMANYRFYNYPYVYAQLFVYALYERYLAEGKLFVSKLENALSAGSSLSPEQIGNLLGLDVTKRDFWKVGMKRFEHFLIGLEAMVGK